MSEQIQEKNAPIVVLLCGWRVGFFWSAQSVFSDTTHQKHYPTNIFTVATILIQTTTTNEKVIECRQSRRWVAHPVLDFIRPKMKLTRRNQAITKITRMTAKHPIYA
mmetsp:Transcript_16496/g.25187  ORF Transcript_16496/g.25187 Transcript_16496/m.25187 type:complete len:107 (+) Transcript_16496:151-471(+)